MRKISKVTVLITFLFCFQWGHAQICILDTLINPSATCTSILQPVCGCDGTTYSNSCEAEKHGVSAWTSGACPGTGCHAAFSYFSNGFNVNFTDQSDSNVATIVSWLWDFGDGTTSTLRNPVHTYSSNGEYLVSLEINDMSFVGCQSKQTKLVHVAPPMGSPFATNNDFLYYASTGLVDTIDNQELHIWTPEFYDAEGDSIFIHYISLTNTGAGTVTYDYATGQIIVTPDSNYTGSTGLVIEVCDVNIDCFIYSLYLYMDDITSISEFQKYGFDFEIRGDREPFVYLQSKTSQRIQVEYFDMKGRCIYSEFENISNGFTSLPIKNNRLVESSYLIRITDETGYTISKKYWKY